MFNRNHLHILWTSDNKVNFTKMVYLYALNSITQGWWKKVTIIIWGASAKLAAEDSEVKEQLRNLKNEGVHISVCKKCAEELQIDEKLEKEGIESIYWGEPLTKLLKWNKKVITV